MSLVINDYIHQIRYVDKHIIALITNYYLENRLINIHGNIISNNITNGGVLILYKNFNRQFIEYDKINPDKPFTIFATYNELGGVPADVGLIKVEINPFDTSVMVQIKILSKLKIAKPAGSLRMIFNGQTITIRALDLIVDYGVQQGSIISLQPVKWR